MVTNLSRTFPGELDTGELANTVLSLAKKGQVGREVICPVF